MKLQGMGIIFAIVILPITVILSYFIQIQVDTINLQTSYDAKIIDATHDAMAALELNTANENMSTVSDSLRSILEASNSIFFNTLLTDFGLSNGKNSLLEPYIPAILYTLYDGYYIYSQTNAPVIITYKYNEDSALVNHTETDNKGIIIFVYTDTHDKAGQPVYTETGELIYACASPDTPISNNPPGPNIGTNNINKGDIKYQNKYMLKSYMPYSARYTWSGNDVTINYTLDNYLNIAGTVNNVYYTKTGYLIDPSSVSYADGIKKYDKDHNEYKPVSDFDFDIYNEQDAEKLIASGEYSNIKIEVKIPKRDKDGIIETLGGDVQYIGSNSELKVDYEAYSAEIGGVRNADGTMASLGFFKDSSDGKDGIYHEGVKIIHDVDYESLESLQELERLALDHYQVARAEQESGISNIDDLSYNPDDCLELLNIVKPKIQMIQAVQYYVRNRIFSNWVYTYLKDIQESDIDEAITVSEKKMFEEADADLQKKNADYVTIFKDLKEKGTGVYIFGNPKQDTEVESVFINHKCNVIRNSIQHNLNLAFTIHTMKSNGMLFEVPILSDVEWDKITRYVSMVSFFGGMPCGSKTYSNYALISSTNNEITVIPEELFYIKSTKFNDRESEVHRIDCEKYIDDLGLADGGSDPTGIALIMSETQPSMISLRSKDIKYDKIYNKTSGRYEYDFQNLTCYDCIVNNNVRFTKNQERGTSVINYNLLQNISGSGSNSQKLLYREYIIAIAAQRQDLYKTNAFTKSEGYESKIINHGIGSGITFIATHSEFTLPSVSAQKAYKDLKAIEIVIDNFHSSSNMETVVPITVFLGDVEVGTQTLVLNKYSKNQTIRIEIDPFLLKDEVSTNIVIKLKRDTTVTQIEGKYKGVRFIYK